MGVTTNFQRVLVQRLIKPTSSQGSDFCYLRNNMKTQTVEWEHEIESNFRVCSVKSLQVDSISEWGAACYFPIKHGGIMGNVHLNSWRGNVEEGLCSKSLFLPLTIHKRSKLFFMNRGLKNHTAVGNLDLFHLPTLTHNSFIH